jgi:hypothetical protein
MKAQMPNLYVCVYRRHVPGAGEWRRTVERSRDDPTLASFLNEYWRDDRYFDWGDDPSFFGALNELGDARRASWGVCRPNVRRALAPGDGIVFLVLKPEVALNARGIHVPTGPAEYFYVGFGTVGDVVDRSVMWADPQFSAYRTFFNALARPVAGGGLENVEVFPRHKDWIRRASTAPIVFFESATSWFDLHAPTLVARYDPLDGYPERWNDEPTSRRLGQILFAGRDRRLRTSDGGHPHPHLRLSPSQPEFDAMRSDLLRLAGARGRS